MSGLLFLEHSDFFLDKGQQGTVLCTNIKGFSLVLFYSTVCEHCHTFIPIFKKLPLSVGGCQFGMINISKNKPLIAMSNETIAPVKYVPYIVLYVNGRPFMRYDGAREEDAIRKFVFEVAKKVQNKEQFSSEKVKNPSKGDGIPAYTIGKPLCGDGDGVCYLSFDDAYEKKK
jgi:thiol-disulfide isomerase/thioredoxin